MRGDARGPLARLPTPSAEDSRLLWSAVTTAVHHGGVRTEVFVAGEGALAVVLFTDASAIRGRELRRERFQVAGGMAVVAGARCHGLDVESGLNDGRCRSSFWRWPRLKAAMAIRVSVRRSCAPCC